MKVQIQTHCNKII